MDKKEIEKYLRYTFKKRVLFILILFLILLGIIIARLFYFQIIKHEEFLEKSRNQQRRTITLPAKRGNIYDRNNNLYAASIDSFSLYANPRIVSLTNRQVYNLANFLNVSLRNLKKKLNRKNSFVWIKRKLSKKQKKAFKELSYYGIFFGFDKNRKPYIYANPAFFTDYNRYARLLSRVLNLSYDKLIENFQKYDTYFTVKKNLTKEELKKVKQNTYYGFDFIREDERVYLKGDRACHVLGYVGIDNQGLAGIEYKYDKKMKGKDGKVVVENDRKGNEIYSHTKQLHLSENGMNIYLTIDNYIQYVAEKEIAAAVKEYEAISGTVIAMKPETGDILAMAVYPPYDPNKYSGYSSKTLLNKAVSLVYEPGSTFKVITVASALEEGVIDIDSRIKCPPEIEVGGRIIKEAHYDKDEIDKTKILTPAQILKDSVNVGAAKIGMDLGAAKFYKKIRDFGFGQKTGIDMPGESVGILRHYGTWYESDKAIIPFGHTISVTAIQMINAISAICNDGVLMKPKIVRKVSRFDEKYVHTLPNKEIRRVISKENARKVREMMRDVVTDGTGMAADIAGYSVIGKTGTAEKINPTGRGYLRGSYITSFVGALPEKNPEIVMLVVLDDPQKYKYASLTAVPVFRNIMEKALHYMVIPPQLDYGEEILADNK